MSERYKRKQSLADIYDCSMSFVNTIIGEMRESGIYGEFRISDVNFTRIDVNAFEHYLKNRHKIKNGQKYEPFVRG